MDAAAAGEPASSAALPPELVMVARAVQRLVARNDALLLMLETAGGGGQGTARSKGLAAFEAARGAPPPRIGVAEYMGRVHRYAALEPECYVVAYAYIDRAAHRRPAAAVASRNVHRLLLACLLVASKVHDDFHHSNAFFARVGGVSNAEMNKLELELLGLLDFEVALGRRAYDRYREHLEKEMLWNNGGGGGGVVIANVVTAKARPPSKPLVAPLTAAVVAAPLRPRPPKPNGVPVLRELCVAD